MEQVKLVQQVKLVSSGASEAGAAREADAAGAAGAAVLACGKGLDWAGSDAKGYTDPLVCLYTEAGFSVARTNNIFLFNSK